MKYKYLLLLIYSISTLIYAQEVIDNKLENFLENYARGYVQPLVDAFGENLTSGWSSFTPLEKNKLSFDVGLQSIIMLVNDDRKTFKINSPYDDVEQEVPTILGGDNTVYISRTNVDPGITLIPDKYPGGFNYSAIPLFMPHFSIGNIGGTRFMFRFLPKIKIYDFAYIYAIGVGVQHSISRYIKKSPVGISLTGAYQNITLGNIANANSLYFGAQIYKSFPVLTLYSDFGIKYTNINFDYTATFSDPSQPDQIISQRINFDLTASNNFKFSAGIAINLLLIKLNAGYSFTSPQSVLIGAGVGW